MIEVKLKGGYWLNESLTLDVSTEQAREKAIKRLEGLIHGLPQILEAHNKSKKHSYVEFSDSYICHIVCDEQYKKTGIKEPVIEIAKL